MALLSQPKRKENVGDDGGPLAKKKMEEDDGEMRQ